MAGIRERCFAAIREHYSSIKCFASATKISFPTVYHLDDWSRIGERLLRAVCLGTGVAPRWVLTGEGPRALTMGDWPHVPVFPADLRWMIRADQRGASPLWNHKGGNILWEAPCLVCGRRVQRFSRRSKIPLVPRNYRPLWVCCGAKRCVTEIKRRKWDAMYAKKTQALGYAPCRVCLTARPRPGSTRCAACKDGEWVRQINKMEDRVVAGVCLHPKCTNPLKPDSNMCHMHHEIRSETFLAHRVEVMAKWSALPLEERQRRQRESYAVKLLRAQITGSCLQCGKPASDPDARYPLCERHRRIRASYRRCCNLRKKHWTRISVRTLLLKVRLPIP